MAEIVKARDTSDPAGPIVAVKRILPHLCDDAQYRAMFLDESRVLAQLRHPSIIHAYEIGEIEGTPYIALEYVDGQDARALFHETRAAESCIPIPIACYITARVCEALHHAHEQTDAEGQLLGLVHRDVSLQNILISYDGDVKLTDFGIAVSAENESRTEVGVVKGKFGYMSPEQIKGAPLDRRSDVFAVGICLYELLTGERLFAGDSDYKAVERVRNVDIEPPSVYNRQIPSGLERIVLKALAKLPRDRYQSTNDLRRALQAFMAETNAFAEREDLAAYLQMVFPELPEPASQPEPRDPTLAAAERSDATHAGLADDEPAQAGEDITRDLRPARARTGAFDDPTTGLSAFDDLDPVSALHFLPQSAQTAGATAGGSGTLRLPSFSPRDAAGLASAPSAHSAPSVPPLIPRPHSIPAGHTPPPQPMPSGPASPRFDMDWDEYEPTTVSQGLAPTPSLPNPNFDDEAEVTRVHHGAEIAQLDARWRERAADEIAANRSLPTLQITRPPDTSSRGWLLAACAAVLLIAVAYFARGSSRGSLQLQTDPVDAIVRVDGKRVPVTSSPFILTNLATNVAHTLTVEKPGYVGWSTQLRVRGGSTLALPLVKLEAVAASPAAEQAPPPTATVEAVEPSQPPAARVEARQVPKTAPPKRWSARAKPRSVGPRASRASARRARATAATAKSATGTGTLRINTRPWSQISIDGRVVGNTPQMSLALSAGSHKVVLTNPQFGIRKTMTVKIEPGKVVTRVLSLTP